MKNKLKLICPSSNIRTSQVQIRFAVSTQQIANCMTIKENFATEKTILLFKFCIENDVLIKKQKIF